MGLRINLGSGQRRFEKPWINIDKVYGREGHEPDLVADGSNLPLPDQSAEVVVLHHVLEHFGCGEADSLIKEAYRVLRRGGSCLVFVPDLRALASRWLTRRLDTQVYLTNLYGAYMGREEDRHAWGYDEDYLEHYLIETADWTGIQDFDWREIEGADIARDWWILGVEAVK